MSARIWSDEQKAIFHWAKTSMANDKFCKVVVIKSRAGTGKTTTTGEMLMFYVPETNTAYFVFGKKNQIEAKDKIKKQGLTIRTLHSQGLACLVSVWGKLELDNWVENDRIKKVQPDIPEEIIYTIVRLIGYLKNGFINVPSLTEAKQIADLRGIEAYGQHKAWNDKLPEIAIKAMELAKKKDLQNRISFDDMVWLPCALDIVKPLYDFIAVDEVQDMNLPQLEMVIKLLNPGGRIALIGDDRQAIFCFRGAMFNSLDIFKSRLNAEELTLNITYRCPKSVVALAQTIVPDYVSHESAPEGIVESVQYDKVIESIKIGDVILSRTNAPLMPLCLKMLRQNITARVEGRDIGKTLIGIIKGIISDYKMNSVPEFLIKLDDWQQFHIARATGKYAQRKIDLVKDQYETIKCVAESCNGIGDIENKLNSLFIDSSYAKKPAVVCSSVHKAKGLEWPSVYILSDTFGRNHPKMTPADHEEEKNIHYVAITRAKHRLVLVEGLGKK